MIPTEAELTKVTNSLGLVPYAGLAPSMRATVLSLTLMALSLQEERRRNTRYVVSEDGSIKPLGGESD